MPFVISMRKRHLDNTTLFVFPKRVIRVSESAKKGWDFHLLDKCVLFIHNVYSKVWKWLLQSYHVPQSLINNTINNYTQHNNCELAMEYIIKNSPLINTMWLIISKNHLTIDKDPLSSPELPLMPKALLLLLFFKYNKSLLFIALSLVILWIFCLWFF